MTWQDPYEEPEEEFQPPPTPAAQAAAQGQAWVDTWELEQAQMDEAVQLSMALEASSRTFEREQHYRTEYLVSFQHLLISVCS